MKKVQKSRIYYIRFYTERPEIKAWVWNSSFAVGLAKGRPRWKDTEPQRFVQLLVSFGSTVRIILWELIRIRWSCLFFCTFGNCLSLSQSTFLPISNRCFFPYHSMKEWPFIPPIYSVFSLAGNSLILRSVCKHAMAFFLFSC